MLSQKIGFLIFLLSFSIHGTAQDWMLDSLHDQLADAKNAEERSLYLNKIGTILCVRGEQSTGIKYILESIRISEEIRDSAQLYTRYMALGNTFARIGQEEKGIGYLHKSRQLAAAERDTFILANIFTNLSAVHNHIDNYDSALYYCDQATILQRLINNPVSLARTIIAKGRIYDKKGEIEKSIGNYTEALELVSPFLGKDWPSSQQMSLDITVESVYHNLGKAYVKIGELDSALKYLEMVVNFDSDFASLYIQKFAHESLAESYELKGDYKTSLYHYKYYSNLSDSILDQGRIETINEITAKYETTKKELENNALRQKNEIIQQNSLLKDEKIWMSNILIFVIVFFTLALTIAFIFLLIRNRLVRNLNVQLAQKNEALQFAKQKHELKALLNQINPHFIFNALNSIQQFIVHNDTKSSFEYFNRFGSLIRFSLEHSNLKFVVINEEIEVINNYVILENLRFKDDITLKVETHNIDTYNVKIPPMFIQPLIENAIIHGLSEKDGDKQILLEFEEMEEIIICMVTDNGVGRSSTEKKDERERNSGLIITKNRLKSIWMHSKSIVEMAFEDLADENKNPLGTRVVIYLPKSF